MCFIGVFVSSRNNSEHVFASCGAVLADRPSRVTRGNMNDKHTTFFKAAFAEPYRRDSHKVSQLNKYHG